MAVVPLIIVAGLSVFNLFQSSTLLRATLEESEAAATKEADLTKANIGINGEMLTLVSTFSKLQSTHQRSLLTKNAGLTEATLSVRKQAEAQVSKFIGPAPSLVRQLDCSGFLRAEVKSCMSEASPSVPGVSRQH